MAGAPTSSDARGGGASARAAQRKAHPDGHRVRMHTRLAPAAEELCAGPAAARRRGEEWGWEARQLAAAPRPAPSKQRQHLPVENKLGSAPEPAHSRHQPLTETVYQSPPPVTRLLSGESGISNIDRFDASEFPTRFGGQIKNFDDEG